MEAVWWWCFLAASSKNGEDDVIVIIVLWMLGLPAAVIVLLVSSSSAAVAAAVEDSRGIIIAIRIDENIFPGGRAGSSPCSVSLPSSWFALLLLLLLLAKFRKNEFVPYLYWTLARGREGAREKESVCS
jgi:hypothetical protein